VEASPGRLGEIFAHMNFGRTSVNVVVLPTGRILIIGGHSNGQKWSPTPVWLTEIYDPGTEKWTVGAPLNFPRQYHSVCILLADGSAVTAAGSPQVRQSPTSTRLSFIRGVI